MSFSPGIVRETKPAARIASENTSALAPRSNVRSRSKNAAPAGSGGLAALDEALLDLPADLDVDLPADLDDLAGFDDAALPVGFDDLAFVPT